MHIELTSKNTWWYGSKGVVIHAQVDVHEYAAPVGTEPGLSRMPSIQRLSIYLTGTDTKPKVEISRASWSFGTEPTEDAAAALTADLHHWLERVNPLGWRQEVDRYQAALSRVDLPCPPEDVQTEDKALIYKVTVVGEDDFNIALPLEVKHDSSRVSVGLVKGGAENYIYIGDCYIDGTISLDTLKAAIMPAMERFMKGVQNLMERVALPEEAGV